MRMPIIAVVLIVTLSAASAQSDPGPNHTPAPPAQVLESGIAKNSNLGDAKAPAATSPSESNAVGGLGSSADRSSAPPAMLKDCQRNAADCAEPSATGTTQPAAPSR